MANRIALAEKLPGYARNSQADVFYDAFQKEKDATPPGLTFDQISNAEKLDKAGHLVVGLALYYASLSALQKLPETNEKKENIGIVEFSITQTTDNLGSLISELTGFGSLDSNEKRQATRAHFVAVAKKAAKFYWEGDDTADTSLVAKDARLVLQFMPTRNK